MPWPAGRFDAGWSAQSLMGSRQWFLLYILVCLEVGIFLILVPWSAIWERNFFLQSYPALGTLVLDPMFRGAVSGLGVANIYLGLNEFMGRRTRRSTSTELFPSGAPRTSRSPEQASSVTDNAEPQTVATHEKHS
jgi:hypothetical protein